MPEALKSMSLMACTTTISRPGANQPIRPKKECFEMIGTILPYERLGPESLLRAMKVLPNAEESLGRGSTPCLDSQPLLFVFLVSRSTCDRQAVLAKVNYTQDINEKHTNISNIDQTSVRNAEHRRLTRLFIFRSFFCTSQNRKTPADVRLTSSNFLPTFSFSPPPLKREKS